LFLATCAADLAALPSFPTRRSSDLGGIALALFLLLRGYRRSSRVTVLGGWLVSAWQVSLGFTLGLQYCYLLAVIGLVAVVWWARSEEHTSELQSLRHLVCRLLLEKK